MLASWLFGLCFDWLVGYLGCTSWPFGLYFDLASWLYFVAMECAKDGDVLARAIGDEKFGRDIVDTVFHT